MSTLILGYIACPANASANDFTVTVDENKIDTDNDKIDHNKYGDGKMKNKAYVYAVSIRCFASEPVEGIRLRLLCYGEQHFDDDIKKLRHVIEEKDITADPKEIENLELGPITYVYGESVKKSSTMITTYKFGYENYAYVLEVYQDDKLVDTIFSKSSSKFKKLYEKTKNSKPDKK